VELLGAKRDIPVETLVIPPLSLRAMTAARLRLKNQARPQGALGTLEELAISVAGMFDDEAPPPPEIRAIAMCGDHGVAEELVSVFPQEVTRNISGAFLEGKTAFNIFSQHVGADTEIVDCGVIGDLPHSTKLVQKKIRPGTDNIAKGPAMTLDEALQTLNIGIERAFIAHQQGFRVLALGEIGNSNTTVAAALLSGLTGIPPFLTVGKGTGVPDWQKMHKINVVNRAIALNSPRLDDPIDCLRSLGGFEIGAMAGVAIGAASRRMCIVIDGFISTVAALLAVRISPRVRQYMVFGHITPESGHGQLLQCLEAKPLLDLGFRLGEGTGAILAAGLVRLSCAVLSEMATFDMLHTPDPYKA
jgi:nicotinate-nucleotide--dimethylbenzimidazole phosphoribosyltransferase